MNRLLRIAYILFISVITIGLVFFMFIHIKMGLATSEDKLILGVYVIMIIWALMKLYVAFKDLRNSSKDKK